MKRGNQRDKKTPMFESAIPTNYDFVDYTEAEKHEAEQAHKEGTFGNKNVEAGQPKMRSIFDQLVETKEHDVDLPEERGNKPQQNTFSGQQQYGSFGQQTSKPSGNNIKQDDKLNIKINPQSDFSNFPPPPGAGSDRHNNIQSNYQPNSYGKGYTNQGNSQGNFSTSSNFAKKEYEMNGGPQHTQKPQPPTINYQQPSSSSHNASLNNSRQAPTLNNNYGNPNIQASSNSNYGSPQTFVKQGPSQGYPAASSQYQSPQQPAKTNPNLANSQHTNSYQTTSVSSSYMTQSTKVPASSGSTGTSVGGYSDPALLAMLPESVRNNILSMIERSKNSK